MKPYYEHGGVTIYHGDCRDALAGLRADLVVSDPPFGIGDKPQDSAGRRQGLRTGRTNTWHLPSDWDLTLPVEALRAIGKVSGTAALFGHWRMREAVAAAIGLPLRAEIVWSKNCHAGPPCPLSMEDERIWLFGEAAIRLSRFDVTVWDEQVIPTWARKEHKNEKPIKLMTRLVSLFHAGVVLDPFMGSGTTLVAAKQLGRRATGIEIEERYCEIAAKRLSQEVLPLHEAREPNPEQVELLGVER